MDNIRVVNFAKEHLEAAGILLAARHRSERRLYPLLPGLYEDPAEAQELVRAAMGYADGVAAFDGEALVGLLFALPHIVDPASPRARYASPRESMLFAHSHAAAAGIEPFAVYHPLFAELADRLLGTEIFVHMAHVPAGDPAVLDAWYALGFGKANAVAIRDLRPLPEGRAGGVEVREAMPEDIEAVLRLGEEEERFHATSPIFRPYVAGQTRAAVRAVLEEELASDGCAYLIARLDGEDVGVLDVGPARGSPLYIPEGAAYIGTTAVLPASRGGGAGAALVDAALRWAREHGHEAVTLHFTTANALSSSFWTGLGFEVAMWHLRLRLDERIATHRP